MKNKGITLIALIVTIIVLLILAGVTINVVFKENGILEKAQRAKEETRKANAIEKVETAVLETINGSSEFDLKLLKDNLNKVQGIELITEDIPGLPYDVTVDGYIITIDIDLSVKIKGKDTTESDGQTEKGDKTPETSEYKKKGNIYINTPDLSYLDPESVYYITYDENGENPQIAGRIDRIDTPTDWYDYEAKKWANIVTVTDSQVAYWVWIPRYAYKTNSSEENVDIKFISVENEYKNNEGIVEEIPSDYKIPDSFKFGDVNLTGYWMAKYEVQKEAEEYIAISPNTNLIYVDTSKEEPTSTYSIYINGEKKYTDISLPYTVSGLKENKMYDICVVNESNVLARKQVKTKKQFEISLDGLDLSHTFYVTYDENGQNPQIVGRVDKVPEPENWYNYAAKRWANIVTVNGSSVAYWVWIPRYEYIVNENEMIDIKFIPKEQTEPDPEYTIPDSFTFGDVNLAGYWMSKYEVTDQSSETIAVSASINEITVNASNSSENETYEVYIDGELKYTGTLPYTQKGLKENKEYNVYVLKDGMIIGAEDIKTKKIEIDLTGLDKNNTYYVVYNDDETYNLVPLSEGEPENWYNYAERKWANIVTKSADGTQEAWWVWIPRYEYIIFQTSQTIDVRFISKEQTEPEAGYTIPDSFTFGDVNLAGYWMSKYEVSQ